MLLFFDFLFADQLKTLDSASIEYKKIQSPSIASDWSVWDQMIAHILFTTFVKIVSLITQKSVARIICQHANNLKPLKCNGSRGKFSLFHWDLNTVFQSDWRAAINVNNMASIITAVSSIEFVTCFDRDNLLNHSIF